MPHFTSALSPRRATPGSRGAPPQTAVPGALPGFVLPPPLPLELGTQSRDAFDAGAKAEVVTWMFLFWMFFFQGESSQLRFPFAVASLAMQGGSTAEPRRGELGQGWATSPLGNPGQVALPLHASVSPSVKWGQ